MTQRKSHLSTPILPCIQPDNYFLTNFNNKRKKIINNCINKESNIHAQKESIDIRFNFYTNLVNEKLNIEPNITSMQLFHLNWWN